MTPLARRSPLSFCPGRGTPFNGRASHSRLRGIGPPCFGGEQQRELSITVVAQIRFRQDLAAQLATILCKFSLVNTSVSMSLIRNCIYLGAELRALLPLDRSNRKNASKLKGPDYQSPAALTQRYYLNQIAA